LEETSGWSGLAKSETGPCHLSYDLVFLKRLTIGPRYNDGLTIS